MTDPQDRVSATEIYDLYTRWYIKNRGKYVPSMNAFGKQLTRKIHKDRKGGVVYYYGVQLNPLAQDAYPEKKSEKESGYGKNLWGEAPRAMTRT